MTEVVETIKGRKLDARYTLLDKLGAGGQGEVWRAHDGTRGIDIALKVLNPSANQAQAWNALQHEYAIASRLDHPSILKVFPPERSGDVMILPMELASGGDLRRLRGAGFLEIIPVLLEIAQALEHAHERGVVHRDLKPGNVLFDARGRARLADFGVADTAMTPADAKAEGSGAAPPATRDTNRHGFSPFTASPAQLRGEPPTPADDVYGLGALAYELLSGYPPYYPHFDKKRAIEERVPTLVPTRQIPPLLGALVMHLLAKDPKRRPRTMREVIDELDAALNDTLTFDFENVTSSTPTTSISATALQANSSRAIPQPGAAEATNTSEAAAKQFVWTAESEDRRASHDRRGRRKGDSGSLSDNDSTARAGRVASDGPATRASPATNAGSTDSDGLLAGSHPPASGAPAARDGVGRRASPAINAGSTSGDGLPAVDRPPASGARAGSGGALTKGSSGASGGAATSASEGRDPSASISGAPANGATPPNSGAASSPGASGLHQAESGTRSPLRSGAEALARIDAALERAAAESSAHPKATPSTPLTPAEAAAIVAAARAASKSPSQTATNQPTSQPTSANQSSASAQPPYAGPPAADTTTPAPTPNSVPPAPARSMWPRERTSSPASPANAGPSRAASTAPTSAPDPGLTLPLQSLKPGTSPSASATSRTAAQPTPWHSTPGQPTTTHWAPESTPHRLSLQPAPSNAPPSGRAAPAQPTWGDETVVLPPLSNVPPLGHEAPAKPTSGDVTAVLPATSNAPPLGRHATPAKPTSGDVTAVLPATSNAPPLGRHPAPAQPTWGDVTVALPPSSNSPPSGHAAPAQPTWRDAPPPPPAPGSAASAQQGPGGYAAAAERARLEAASGAYAPYTQSTPGHGPFAATPASSAAYPPHAQYTPAAGIQPAAGPYPATVPFGPRGSPTSIHAGPMHATWREIALDGLPKIARLEPIRPRRWPWVVLGLLAGGAAAVYFWLPRFDMQTLPPEVAAVVAPLKAALTPNSPTPSGAPAGAASGSSPEGTTVQQSATPPSAPAAIQPSASAPSATVPTPYGAGTASAGTAAAPYEAGTAATPGIAAPAATASSATASSGTTSSGTAFPATASPNARTSPPTGPAADEQRLRELRQTFDTRIAALETRGAGAWGGREFATAKIRAAESVGAHDAGNPRVAQERLTAAMKLLDTVDSKAPQVFSAEVAAGEKALGAGQQEVAGQAFDLARRINPTDRRASDGLHRTQNLNALLPLLADAQNAEAAHDYARAAQAYSQALSLDPGNATAKAGQARANSAFGDDNYAKAVGSGFAALGAGRLDAARDAFVNARALKPNGAEASEGLRRVSAALAARGYASMRERAAGLEEQERWDDARRVYEDALAADPSLAFAQEGKARTTSRADLSGRLQQLLDRPDRLSTPGVREDARALLETARAQSPQGPVIRSQIARLEILLPGFDKPVRLSLLSDNSTQVVISSIGSFGSFARRDIELRPGKYTVLGTRYGFRDVRREITVAPGQDTQTIRVTCSDPI
ncbi:MAG: protein kinase domain-containing protein [Steroidobacteraceae bacterium]